MSQAQSRVSFEIPLPPQLSGDFKPVETWASRAGTPEDFHAVRITFANGVDLDISAEASPPNVQALVDAHSPEFELIQVGAHQAMGDDPEIKVIHGKELQEPGVVAWWQNGTHVALYSDTLSMAELLEVASLFAR